LRKKKPFRRRGPGHRINEFIKAEQVRVVGESIKEGVYTLEAARELAQKENLDLVEIASNAKPPVCQIVDYSKFLYQKKKKDKELKSKTVKTVLKEIRFTPHTDEHDFEFKAKHAEKFLSEGAKVKAFVQFRGRNIVFKEKGTQLLLKLAEVLDGVSKIEQEPKMEGRRMHMLLNPTRGKKS